MMTMLSRPLLEDVSCIADLGHVRLLLHPLLVRQTHSLVINHLNYQAHANAHRPLARRGQWPWATPW